ncbi:MAG TPA: molybdopterin-dependent oxidoreductase, partial [Thermomicrobiales bacterium]|nr:molybdopterin-dependent oxidoreductase [Thermomicrobiales bacterium]
MTTTFEPNPVPPNPLAANQPTESKNPIDRERLDLWRGVTAGGVAGIIMLVTIILLRSFTGIISFLDVLADALLLVLPISWFAALLSLFGAQAKTLLLVGLMALLILLGAWVGRSYAHHTAGSRRAQWARAAAYGISMYAGFAAFTALFVSDQDPDLAAGGGILKVLGLLGVAIIVYTVAMPVGLRILRRQDPAPRFLWGDEVANAADAEALAAGTYDRRRLFTRIGFGIATIAGIGVLGKEVLRVANRKITSSENAGQMPSPITSNDDFYVISKNFVDPSPQRGDDWSIEIAGLVTTPMTLKKTDLEAFGVQEFVSTLNCISNPVGGPLISTAKWTGVPLAKVLRKAGVGNGAVKLIADADDGYQDSISIEKALSPEPFIVWEMNGENLPRLHGVPVRLIVPGIYGMKNVKWLTKLTVTNQ